MKELSAATSSQFFLNKKKGFQAILFSVSGHHGVKEWKASGLLIKQQPLQEGIVYHWQSGEVGARSARQQAKHVWEGMLRYR